MWFQGWEKIKLYMQDNLLYLCGYIYFEPPQLQGESDSPAAGPLESKLQVEGSNLCVSILFFSYLVSVLFFTFFF